MINTKPSPPQTDNRSRGRAIPSIVEDTYVKKDGFLVAKATKAPQQQIPTLLGKCKGFAFVLVGT